VLAQAPGKFTRLTHLARFRLKLALAEPMRFSTLSLISSMASATHVHRTPAGTSSTKAAMCHGLQRQLQQCATVIWVNKFTAAGCLA
jgi:hypothetical protein